MAEPATAIARPRRLFVRLLWTAALLLLVGIVLRLFVADVYPVASSSMEPTLFPGDRVLVLFDRSLPRRGELLVVRGEDGLPLVKRVAGLPGEELVITSGGDLRIGRDLVRDPDQQVPWIPVFDSDALSLTDHFRAEPGVPTWAAGAGGVWTLDTRAEGSACRLSLVRGVHDDHLGPEGVVYGTLPVGDLALEWTWRALEPTGVLLAELTECGDRFELRVELGEEPRLRLLRLRDPGHGDDSVPALQELANAPLDGEPDAWHTTRLQNRDDQLLVLQDGEELARVPYARNCPGPGPDGGSVGERVHLTASGALLELRHLRVERDVHHAARGDFGVSRRVRLGQDELFLLGDNSAHSRDSRDFGPVPVSRILGRPQAVVWPAANRRWLR